MFRRGSKLSCTLRASDSRSKVFDNHADHQPVAVLPGGENLDLLHIVPAISPQPVKYEIPSKSCAAELRSKSFSVPNRRGDFFLACPSLDHPSDRMGVELHSHRLCPRVANCARHVGA